jgi:hypothetical protein
MDRPKNGHGNYSMQRRKQFFRLRSGFAELLTIAAAKLYGGLRLIHSSHFLE